MMDLLRCQGFEVLTNTYIPKFSKIFVMLIKLDHLLRDSQDRPKCEWPEVIHDLVTLPEHTNNFDHQKNFIRFITKTLAIIEEDIVDR